MEENSFKNLAVLKSIFFLKSTFLKRSSSFFFQISYRRGNKIFNYFIFFKSVSLNRKRTTKGLEGSHFFANYFIFCKSVSINRKRTTKSLEGSYFLANYIIFFKGVSIKLSARSLVVSDLRSETKGSRFEPGC